MKHITKEAILLALILVLALFVRIWGANYDLPFIYHPDEPNYIIIIQNIFKTGDLNPHFFNYPSLFFYINALAYLPYYLIGKLLGIVHTPTDILAPISLAGGVTRAPMQTTVILGRIVTICFGTGLVGLTYFIGKQITGRKLAGLLAALMVAISSTNVLNSRMITPDTFVTFFSLASFLATLWAYQQGKTWQYIVCGLCVGLTASSKYNGGLVILPLLLVYFFQYGITAFKQPKLYLVLLFCGVGFFATTPFAILDSAKFLADLRYESIHYSTGHPGMEGNTLGWYLDYLWTTGGGLYILAIIEILRGIFIRSKKIILLSVYSLAYFIFICSFIVRNDRTILPLIPFLFLLAASFLVYLLDKANTLKQKKLRRGSIVIIVCLFIAGLTLPISKTITDTIKTTTVNSRETSRVWITNNLPPGAKIAIEPYSPFLNPSQFSIQGFGRIIVHTPEWYVEQGFDYLIFSQGMYGRFYFEPERYGQEIAQYNNLFEKFNPVKIFTDGDFEVRVYKVK